MSTSREMKFEFHMIEFIFHETEFICLVMSWICQANLTWNVSQSSSQLLRTSSSREKFFFLME